jgi:hypothetical protein
MFKSFVCGLILLAMSLGVLAAESGTVCIAPVPTATSGTKSLSNATASSVPYDFAVTINRGKPTIVSHKAPSPIRGLDLAKRHSVQIKQAGRAKAAFSFRFSDHKSNNLCLWFNPLYESWSISPVAVHKRNCRCGG